MARSFAALGLAFIICGAGGGCSREYQATVYCQYCGDVSISVTGEWRCSEQSAIGSATTLCIQGNGVASNPVVDSQLTLGLCDGDRATLRTSETVRDAVRQARQRVGLARQAPAVEAADAPTCPPRKVNLKVTVVQAVPVPECPGDIEVEVNYQKYISDGVFEYTTLSAIVPLGGEHEFLCTDAAVNETTGKVNTIRVAVLTDLNCLGQPDMLANAYVYSTIPPDGSSLKVSTDLASNTQTHEIIPPAAPALDTVSATVRRELLPIPDPRFTQRHR